MKNNKFIKVSEAAKLLDVTSQTVLNWCARGLITHRGNRGYGYRVSLQSVEKHLYDLKMVAVEEKQIEEYRNKLKENIQKLKNRLGEINAEMKERELVPKYASILSAHITGFLNMVSGQAINDSEAAMMVAIINGKTYEDIAQMNQLTREGVRSIVQRAFRRLCRLPLYAELLNETFCLRDENAKLKRATQGLLLRVERYENIDEEKAKRLGTLITELPLSVRTVNCLTRTGIQTVDELCQMSPTDLLKLRNFGRKCLWEVEDALEELELNLKRR